MQRSLHLVAVFNSTDNNMGALHCTRCTSSMTVVPPVSFSFHIHAHGASASLALHLRLSTVIHQSPWRPVNSLLCLTVHLCIDSAHVQTRNWFLCIQFICSHWCDQPQCKNQWSTEELSRHCVGAVYLIRYRESAHNKIHRRPITNCSYKKVYFKAALINIFILSMAQGIKCNVKGVSHSDFIQVPIPIRLGLLV